MTVGFATFSPDDKLLVVSGGDNETAIAFDATNGRELGRFTGAGSSPDPNDAWGSAGSRSWAIDGSRSAPGPVECESSMSRA